MYISSLIDTKIDWSISTLVGLSKFQTVRSYKRNYYIYGYEAINYDFEDLFYLLMGIDLDHESYIIIEV